MASRPRCPELPRPPPTLARKVWGTRGLLPTSRRPPARRYLVGAPPPGPRPAPCAAAAAALFWRRFNSRPREKLSLPRYPAPRVHPEPWRAREPSASLPQGAIVYAARPPARQGGPGRVLAGPGRGRRAHVATFHPPFPGRPCPSAGPCVRRGQRVAGATRRSGQPPETRPSHAAAAATLPRARPPHPPSLPPSGPRLHTTGFTHSVEGRADSPGVVAATIFASPAVGSRSRLPSRLRFTTTGGPRPGVRPAGQPAQRRGFARRADLGGAAGVVPTPSASPEGAKWREGASRAATAAPRRTMWVNEGRRLPPQRKYGQAPLPH